MLARVSGEPRRKQQKNHTFSVVGGSVFNNYPWVIVKLNEYSWAKAQRAVCPGFESLRRYQFFPFPL